MRQNHEIDYKIYGDDMQYVEVELDPMEAAVAEAGGMMYMDDGIEMETIFGDGSKQTREINAGSGYYSQSTAACFFGWQDTNPPRKIHVRWPSGVATDHDVSLRTSKIILGAP